MSERLHESKAELSSSLNRWTYTELSNLLEADGLSYGVVQPGPSDPSGVPILRVKNLRDGRIVADDVMRIRREVEEAHRRTRLRGGEVLLSLVGSVGEVAIVPENMAGWNVARAIGVLRPRGDVSSAWIRLCLRTDLVQHRIRSWRNETVQATLNLRDVRRLPILLPPADVQNSIIDLLGALDDKISINDRIIQRCNELALAMASVILDQDQGEEAALADEAAIVKGVSYRSADLGRGVDWLVTLKCVGSDGKFQPEGLKQYAGPCKDGQIVQSGDLVVAQTDLTQGAAVIGRPVRLVSPGVSGNMIASLDLCVVRPTGKLSRETLFALLSRPHFREHVLKFVNGTTVLHLGSRALPTYHFRMPSVDSIRAVTDATHPLFTRADLVQLENRKLAELRDALVPKLISGELGIRDAEGLISDAV